MSGRRVFAAVALAAGLIGCGEIALREAQFRCDPADPDSCPGGMICQWIPAKADHRCITSPAHHPDGGPDAASDGGTDAASPSCGNGTREAGEVCDGADLGGATCESQGFYGGTLGCSSACNALVTTACLTTPCQPNEAYCDGELPRACDASGQPGNWLTPCASDETCVEGTCLSRCLAAEAAGTVPGCEYWPTPTANSNLDEAFNDNFGVVVHNANDVPATVTITRGGNAVAQQAVPAGQSFTFELSLDTGLKGELPSAPGTPRPSKKVAGAAYHLVSTQPVTTFQFDPLDFVQDATCLNSGTAPCYSYSNDASLLLPAHRLSRNYLVMSRPTFGMEQYYDFMGPTGEYNFIPGYVAIVGTENNTNVTVTSSAYTQAGDVGALSPGDQQTFSLAAGEVLQLLSAQPGNCTAAGMQRTSDDCNQSGGDVTCDYCDAGPAYDLTGTVISASAPVAVLAGHDCSFVPYNAWACDHLEEQLMPLETWGRDFIVGRTKPQNDPGTGFNQPEPNVVRIVSGGDGNVITFTPAQSVGGQITLNQGQFVEFLAGAHFQISASKALSVGQFLVGQNLYTSSVEYWGDPAFALVPPVEQFRTSYAFYVPVSMTYNFLNIVKQVGGGSAPVFLDGAQVPEAQFSLPVGGSTWGVVQLSVAGGNHRIESDDPVGVLVYGFAAYTSYMYPGGMDLEYINPMP